MKDKPSSRQLLLAMLVLLGMLGCQKTQNAPLGDQVAEASPTQYVTEANAPWAPSEDGHVSLRYWFSQASYEPESPFVLIAEIKNTGSASRTFLRPFGDFYTAPAAGVKLIGPQGPLPFKGPTPSYVLGGESYVQLAPGETARDELTISDPPFDQSSVPGLYTLRYRYIADPGTPPPEFSEWNPWVGEVAGPTIEVSKR